MRHDGFIAKTDLGYLFCALSLSYGQSKGESVDERIEAALALLGMPTQKVISQNFKDFWGKPSTILKSLSLEKLVELRLNLSMSGAGAAHIRSVNAGVPISASQFIASGGNLPIIVSGDCNILQFNEFGMSEEDHDVLLTLAHRLDFHTKNSLRAARGYDLSLIHI